MTEQEKIQHLLGMNFDETTRQINDILAQRLPHTGVSRWTLRTPEDKMLSMLMLNDVLSGKHTPYPEAAEYLQSVRKGL